MRFAPPRSAPSDTRKSPPKEQTATARGSQSDVLSGWCLEPDDASSSTPSPTVSWSRDLNLLHQCSQSERQCNSATHRTSGGSLVVNFRHNKTAPSGLRFKSGGKVSTGPVVTTTVASMIPRDCTAEDRDEFSDISDSEASEVSLPVHPGSSEGDSSDLLGRSSQITLLTSEHSMVTSFDGGGTPGSVLSSAQTLSPAQLHVSDRVITLTQQQRIDPHSLPAHLPPKKKMQRRGLVREHHVPSPVTPDIPDTPIATKPQLWSRSRKLEASSPTTTPTSESPVPPPSRKGSASSGDHQLLTSTIESVLHANRPKYRNEQRRLSGSFKSSCSIPSFSTPNQALLLIGMTPSNPPPKPNKNVRKSVAKPPIIARSRPKNNVVELPALGINGAGDLVIRKKQILSG